MIEFIYRGLLIAEIAVVVALALFAMSTRLSIREQAYTNFMSSYSRFGVAILIWGISLLLLRSTYWRFDRPMLAAAVSISTYHIFFRLMSRSLLKLLNVKSIERLRTSFISWLALTLILIIAALDIKNPTVRVAMWVIYAITSIDIICVAIRTLIAYRHRDAESYINDDTELFIVRMKWCFVILMFWCIVNPISGFFPAPWIVFVNCISVLVFIILSILFLSYAVYIQPQNLESSQPENVNINRLDRPIEEWIARKGYLEPMATTVNVAAVLGTNRTYLSSYINERYGVDFRNWIAGLKLEYSKELMVEDPTLTLQDVAQRVNYSNSSFSTIFKRHYGVSVTQWRRTISKSGQN